MSTGKLPVQAPSALPAPAIRKRPTTITYQPMPNPTVDIGITVFERTDYVTQAIESVIEQSYPHWQLIVSEEGKVTEPVRLVIEPYLVDERIHYVTPGEYLGNAGHKSSLLARGHGKYATVLDDDDHWLPEWLERRVSFLEQHAECVLVWAGHFDMDVNGREIERQPFEMTAGVHSSHEFIRQMMHHNLVATPSVLFRRDVYERAGNRFDPRFIHINDYELWLRLGLLGPVGYLQIHDSGYRLHPNQRSREHNKGMDYLLLIDHLDSLLQQYMPDLRSPASVRRRQTADLLLSVALDLAEQGKKKDTIERIAEAARLDPRALASRRGLGAIAAAVAGQRVGRHLGQMRS